MFLSFWGNEKRKKAQIFRTLVLRAYPSEQTIEEGREIVFQCRDEGPLRARVEWRRQSLPLPPGTTLTGDVGGRMEIPNAQVSFWLHYEKKFTILV